MQGTEWLWPLSWTVFLTVAFGLLISSEDTCLRTSHSQKQKPRARLGESGLWFSKRVSCVNGKRWRWGYWLLSTSQLLHLYQFHFTLKESQETTHLRILYTQTTDTWDQMEHAKGKMRDKWGPISLLAFSNQYEKKKVDFWLYASQRKIFLLRCCVGSMLNTIGLYQFHWLTFRFDTLLKFS